MPIQDKVAAARKISELLNGIIKHGDFRLKYKIMVDPPAVDRARFREPRRSWWISAVLTVRYFWSAAPNSCAPSSR